MMVLSILAFVFVRHARFLGLAAADAPLSPQNRYSPVYYSVGGFTSSNSTSNTKAAFPGMLAFPCSP
jgi:hypothetical protein